MNVEESERLAAKLIERGEFHEAERLLTSLVDQNSAYAMIVLAWIYENGYLGSKNVKAARYYYECASSHGRVDADFGLGHLLLEDGKHSEARTAFERGSKRGHIGCMSELGWMQVRGIGGETCEAQGRKMLEEASSKGHLLAQGRIVSMELSSNPSFIKKVGLLKRRTLIGFKAFFELLKNRNSDRVW